MKPRQMTLLAVLGAALASPRLRAIRRRSGHGSVPARVRQWVPAPFSAKEQGKNLPTPGINGCDRMKAHGYFK